jgi:Cytosolic domain of 10TM putative phosphate transporter
MLASTRAALLPSMCCNIFFLQLISSPVLCGVKVDAINHWAKEVRELEASIGEARQRALRSEPTGSFFVFFNDQRSAATAAQVCSPPSSSRHVPELL